MDTVSEFRVEVPQAIVSEGLAQGPYVAVRAEFEPTTLWSKGIDSTNAPLHPTIQQVNHWTLITYPQYWCSESYGSKVVWDS